MQVSGLEFSLSLSHIIENLFFVISLQLYQIHKLAFHLPASLIIMQNALVRKKAASALHIAAFLLINFFPTDLSIVIYIKIAVADLDILRIRLSIFSRLDEEYEQYEPLRFAVHKFERNRICGNAVCSRAAYAPHPYV